MRNSAAAVRIRNSSFGSQTSLFIFHDSTVSRVSLSKEITHAQLVLTAFVLCLQRDDAEVPGLKTCGFAASEDTGSSGVLLSQGCSAEGRVLHILHL